MKFKIVTWFVVIVWLLCGAMMIYAGIRKDEEVANLMKMFFFILPVLWSICYVTRNVVDESCEPGEFEIGRVYELVDLKQCGSCSCGWLKPLMYSGENYDTKKHKKILIMFGMDNPVPTYKYVIAQTVGGLGSLIVFNAFPDSCVRDIGTDYKVVIR